MKLKQYYKQVLLYLLSCFLGLTTLLLTVQPSYAQVVFTDDFTNEYEKWQDVRNAFNFDMWSIVDQQADVFINRGSTLAEIIPKDKYWDNSWKNYTYTLDYTYLQGADKALSFWFKDIFNWYQFHFIGGDYILSHIKNGQEVWRQVGNLNLEAGKTYRMEVRLLDGNIQFFMNDEKQFEYDDPTFNNDHGRIGLKAGAGTVFPTHVQFDNIVVSLISQTFSLPITPLKQTDLTWSAEEYDSATKWSPQKTSIGDWGCMITSINMILNFHGITHFVDGTLITPSTLNTWLKNQVDGFVADGLVNWSAVSRLVKQIHTKTGSVNLEYSKVVGNSLETAIQEIEKNNPVILEVPGHFVVGNGFPQTKDDVAIVDPAYNYNLLSQHTAELQSTRLLTPSFTDLSYIHLAHSDNITVSVINQNNEIPTNHQIYSQFISNSTSTTRSPKVILHELAKPNSENYSIHLTSKTATPHPYTLTIFAYDIDANLTNLTYTGIAGTTENPTVLTIQYKKDAQSTLTSNTSYKHLSTDIKNLFTQQLITKRYVVAELSQLAQAADKATAGNKPRYIAALTQTLNWYEKYITQEAKSLLSERLYEIKKTLQ